MISLKAFKENAAKYFHLCMIEVQPQDVVEICERAIAAEELAEARLLLLHRATHDLSNADAEIRELKTQLVQIKNTESIQRFDAKPVGYLVRGTFFYSKDQAQNSCDHITENFENCIVEPVYLSAEQPKLTVWYGPMPESNGKTNWTALLHRADDPLGYDGHTIDRSEYPDRVRYEADRVRYLIGELEEMPDILAYDADKHSGYVEPIPEGVGQQTLSDTTLELLNKTTVQIQVMPNGYAHASHRKPIHLPQGFYDCLVLTDKLKQIIQDTIEHGTGFAITGTDGIQHVKQEDVLAKPFAEIDYWQGNKLYCTMLEHVENLDIGDKLYLQPPDNLQRITEQDMKTILCEYFYSLNGLCQVGLTGNRAKHVDDWIDSNIGHKTLAKLNENREPKLSTHNLNHLELIKAKRYSFMNCALCSHSVNVAVLVRSKNCSVHICASCAHAIYSEFK